jgi:GDPmannose 4,6-dehydratase
MTNDIAIGPKRALITGIAGQDGILLSKLLLSKGYEVFGLSRRTAEDFSTIIPDDLRAVKYFQCDIEDFRQIENLLLAIQPQEIYNFAGMSFVPESFENPMKCLNSTGLSVLNLLDLMRSREDFSHIRLFQACSSEIFGDSNEYPQGIESEKKPRSPYGAAKLLAFNLCNIYREKYGLYVSTGVTYNHESEYRGVQYVTRKITQELSRIKLGLQNELILGDLTSVRDWGYAGEYVEAMFRSLQEPASNNYIIASGKLNSVEDFLNVSLAVLGLSDRKSEIIKSRVESVRPKENIPLVGETERTLRLLDWKANKDIEEIAYIMTTSDLKTLSRLI